MRRLIGSLQNKNYSPKYATVEVDEAPKYGSVEKKQDEPVLVANTPPATPTQDLNKRLLKKVDSVEKSSKGKLFENGDKKADQNESIAPKTPSPPSSVQKPASEFKETEEEKAVQEKEEVVAVEAKPAEVAAEPEAEKKDTEPLKVEKAEGAPQAQGKKKRKPKKRNKKRNKKNGN